MDHGLVIFYSPFTPLEIAHKMRDLIGQGKAAKSVDGFIGNGNEQHFSLYFEDQPDVLQFKASLEPDGNGTIIKGEFKAALMTRYERKVMVGCFVPFVSIFLIMAVTSLRESDYFFGLGGMLAAMSMVFLCWKLLRDPKAFSRIPAGRQKILAFLEQNLHIVSR